MKKNRSYSCKDVEMLMACKTIAESFKVNISELSSARSDWNEQFAANLIVRIDSAIETHLGIDVRRDLRNATAALSQMLVPALRDTSFLKTQIEDDFRLEPDRRDEILRTLGFIAHHRAAQTKNQENTIQLLYQFKTNLTPAIRQEIESKGIAPTLIDRVIDYADKLREANVYQEAMKGATKEISQEVVNTFNSIYTEIIGISKKAAAYYRYDLLKREHFTFTKVLARLRGSSHSTSNHVTEA